MRSACGPDHTRAHHRSTHSLGIHTRAPSAKACSLACSSSGVSALLCCFMEAGAAADMLCSHGTWVSCVQRGAVAAVAERHRYEPHRALSMTQNQLATALTSVGQGYGGCGVGRESK